MTSPPVTAQADRDNPYMAGMHVTASGNAKFVEREVQAYFIKRQCGQSNRVFDETSLLYELSLAFFNLVKSDKSKECWRLGHMTFFSDTLIPEWRGKLAAQRRALPADEAVLAAKLLDWMDAHTNLLLRLKLNQLMASGKGGEWRSVFRKWREDCKKHRRESVLNIRRLVRSKEVAA